MVPAVALVDLEQAAFTAVEVLAVTADWEASEAGLAAEEAAAVMDLADKQKVGDIPEAVVSEAAATEAALPGVALEARLVDQDQVYMAADPTTYTAVDLAEAHRALARLVELCLVRSAA